MDRVVVGANGVRLDQFDFEGVGREPEREFRRIVRQFASEEADGLQVLTGFDLSLLNTTTVQVAQGIAVGGSGYGDAPDEWGNLFGEGAATREVVLSGFGHGQVNLYVYFRAPRGREQNRAVWNYITNKEEVRKVPTRAVGDWNAVALPAGVPPEDGYYLIGSVEWDGSLVADNLTDRRPLFFEGVRDESGEAVVYELPDFDRDDDRGAAGVRTLHQWVMAAAKRLEELGGRRWHAAPVFGENVRSASGEITVGTTEGEAQAAHAVVAGTPAENRTALLGLLTSVQTVAEGDAKAALRFLPPSLGGRGRIDVDVTAGAVLLSGGTGIERHIQGPVELRRTAGGNPLLDTAGGVGHRGRYTDVKLSAADGAAALLQIDNGAALLTVEGATIDGSGSLALINQLVEVSAAAKVRFVDCTFQAAAGGGTECLRVSAAADVILEGCRFYGAGGAGGAGARLTAGAAGGRVRFKGCIFDGPETGIKIDAGAEDVFSTEGCSFPDVDTAVSCASANYSAAQAADAGGMIAAGHVVGSALVARGGDVALGPDRQVLLRRSGSAIEAKAGGGVLNADIKAGALVAQGGICRFEDNSAGLRLHRNGSRLTLADGADQNAPSASQLHAAELVLGSDPSDVLARFTVDLLPKAWGVIRWDGATVTVDSARGDSAGIGVQLINSAGTPIGDTQEQHIWKVSGLGLPSDLYGLQATISIDNYADLNPAGEALDHLTAFGRIVSADELWLIIGRSTPGGGPLRLKGSDGISYTLTWTITSRL